MPVLWKESYDTPRQHGKKQRYHFADKSPYSQNYGFSSSHIWMWELVHKEGWAPKNWCFQIMVLEKTFESPLNCKESKVLKEILQEIKPEYSLEGLMLKLKLQYFGHLMWRTDSLEKTLMLGKIEKVETEDAMVGRHHQLNGHESEQTLGDNGGQRSLACWGPWGSKESDTT